MNIIPEEPEAYIELPRPTPGLSSLLTMKQFDHYIKANDSKVFGILVQGFPRRMLSSSQADSQSLNKKLPNGLELNKKSLFFLGIGFGILAISRVVKNLTK